MRILVCGGRGFNDIKMLYHILDKLLASKSGVSLLIHGAARGADLIADAWAIERRVPTQAYPANWKLHGKAAGAIRNREMLREGSPDLVVAFPGGKGTANMIQIARTANVAVIHAS